jgi:hypothetical protein
MNYQTERKILNAQERQALASTLELEKVYTLQELVDKAVAMFPKRDGSSMKHVLGTDMIDQGLCVRIDTGKYMKANGVASRPQKYQKKQRFVRTQPALRATLNGQQIIMNADPLEGYTDKQLADELRRRGYEVEARKITNI